MVLSARAEPVTGTINCPVVSEVGRFVDEFIGLITVEPAATTPKNLEIDDFSIFELYGGEWSIRTYPLCKCHGHSNFSSDES